MIVAATVRDANDATAKRPSAGCARKGTSSFDGPFLVLCFGAAAYFFGIRSSAFQTALTTVRALPVEGTHRMRGACLRRVAPLALASCRSYSQAAI